jgi:Lrp/AsnC family transcriptional regulator for asnA, asnC and gidA
MRIDDTDRAIIHELQIDGRMALREIARKLNTSEGTIRSRLKKLQEEGVVQIVAFADPAKMGASCMSLIFLKVMPAMQDAILSEMKAWMEVSYLSVTLGETDICVQAVCKDQAALLVLRQRIASLEGVQELRFLPEVAVHKIHFAQ